MVLLAAGLLAVWAAHAGAVTPGGLDPSFGAAGTGVTALNTGTELHGVAVQTDGQIVAVGDAGPSMVVARFSAAGSLESRFVAGSGVGRAVAIQPDGKIVVAGYDSGGMLVERFNADGSLDPRFGSGGIVHAAPDGRANALALGPAGTIIAAGQLPGSDSFQRVAVLRLGSDGRPDTGIGPGGVDVVDLGQDSVARGVAVQADGKIVLAGSQGPGAHQVLNAFVARLTASGALDRSFGTSGSGVLLQYPLGGGGAVTFNAVALDPAGGVVVGGGSTGLGPPQALFARLTCAGAPDPGFAGGGLAMLPAARTFIGDPLGANAIAVAAGRHVVGAGEYQDSGLKSAALWGFTSNGAPSFTTTAPSGGARASALVLDAAGNFVVAGTITPPGFASSGFVARYIGAGPPGSGGSPCGGLAARAPSVTTGRASPVTATRASLSGFVDPNGTASTYHFEYGTSPAYGSQTSPAFAGSGTTAVTASANLSGLRPNTTYHYRLAAANVAGAAFGADQTFRTARFRTPTITHFTQAHRRWGETKSRNHRRPVGTTFSFILNQPARVTFAFGQRVTGREIHRRCVAQTRHNRGHRACKLTVIRGRVAFAGHAGRNKFAFTGRISRSNRLTPGRYTLRITATNAAGQHSNPQALTFTIVR